MKLPSALVVLMGIALLVAAISCSTTTAEVAPTPNVDATVEARVKQELAAQPTPNSEVAPTPNIDATVEARAKELVAAQAISAPVVVVKEVVPTTTPVPTEAPATAPIPPNTPVPTEAPTTAPIPTTPPVPTATSLPHPTPRPTPIPTPAPIPIPGTLLLAAFAPVELQSEECTETIWPGASDSSPSLTGEWGNTTTVPPEFFYASDVSSQVTRCVEEAVYAATKEWDNYGPLEYWVLEFITSLYEDTIDEAHSLHNELSLCWWISVNDILEKHDTVFALVNRM